MKKNTPFLCLILTVILFAGCGKKIVFDEKVTFPNNNWMFENKEITFNVPLKSSDYPHAIILELDLVGVPNVDEINAVFTIITPNGGTTRRPLLFSFNYPQEPYIKGATDKEKTYHLTVYPKKYFSETGTYTFIVDQYSHNADNYGIRALRLYVEKGKKEKEVERD